MISEDHVTLKTDAENTALITEINYILTHIKKVLNNNVSFFCTSDQINAGEQEKSIKHLPVRTALTGSVGLEGIN